MAYAEKHPHLDGVLDNVLGAFHEARAVGVSTFTILDLSIDANSQLRVVPRYSSHSAARCVMTLRQPPPNVAVQILLLEVDSSLDEQELNALGLGLKINPEFFGEFYKESRPQLDPRHTKIGPAVVTIVRHYKSEEPDPVPIVIIAHPGRDPTLLEARFMELGKIAVLFPNDPSDIIDDPPVPFRHRVTCNYSLHKRQLDPRLHMLTYDIYLATLNSCLEREEEQATITKDSILMPLIPLLYLRMFAIRNHCHNVRCRYRAMYSRKARSIGKVDLLPQERYWLRALLEDSKDELNYLRRYLGSHRSADLLLSASWLKVEEDLIRIHDEAGRLDAELRDILQLQV